MLCRADFEAITDFFSRGARSAWQKPCPLRRRAGSRPRHLPTCPMQLQNIAQNRAHQPKRGLHRVHFGAHRQSVCH